MHLPVIPVLRPHIKGDDTSSSCLFFIICALMNFCCFSTITAIWRWKDATVLLRLLSQNRVCLQTFHTNKKKEGICFSLLIFGALQELVAASPNQRNWKGISIAIFVIVAILASVAISVYIMTPEEEEPRVSGSRFGIEHILDQRFSPQGFNGSWISGTIVGYMLYIVVYKIL